MGAFVSYSHADTEEVSRVVEVIKNTCGQPLWYDHNLRGGDHYFSVIAEQIKENEYFLFMVSDHSVNSDWCMQELQFAMSERRKIIAIWLENVTLPAGVKFIIQNTHYIHWNQNKDDRFSKEINRCFSGQLETESQKSGGEDEGRRMPVNDKYFVTKEQIRKIEELLKLEKENKYSVCFSGENTVLLGLAYELGIKTEKDLIRAKLYYQAGAFKENHDAAFLFAALSLREDEENKDIYLAQMQEAAEKGSVLAMTYYGDILFEGTYGVPSDKEKGVALWKQAAEKGSAVAQYYMSYAYRWGECVEKNHGLSLMYAYCSLEHEFPRAYRILGKMFEFGEFVEENLEEAKRLYKEAIERQDYLSLTYLAGIYYFDDKDYEKAIGLYEKAIAYADEGKIKSGYPYFRYAKCLYFGDGIDKDIHASIDYYFKAAERNHNAAKKCVVDVIMELEDLDRRHALLLKAKELSCRYADYRLGQMAMESEPEKAIAYYKSGADSGDFYSIVELLKLYSPILSSNENKKYVNREEALRYHQLLFTFAGNQEYLKEFEEAYRLEVFYYAYGIDLAYDYEKPDIRLAAYYFDKSLEKDPKAFFRNILNFAINGFLFTKQNTERLKSNPEYCAVFLEVLEKHLGNFVHAQENKDEVIAALEFMIKGYLRLAEIYRKGEGVKKDKEKSEAFEERAQRIRKNPMAL